MSQLVLISPYSDRKGISHKSKSLFDFFNRLYFSYLTTLTAHFMNFDNYFDKVFIGTAIENEFTRTRARFMMGKKLCPLFYRIFSWCKVRKPTQNTLVHRLYALVHWWQCDQSWWFFVLLGNFLKPFATINLPKCSTFLGNFCKGAKIIHFCNEIIFGQLL